VGGGSSIARGTGRLSQPLLRARPRPRRRRAARSHARDPRGQDRTRAGACRPRGGAAARRRVSRRCGVLAARQIAELWVTRRPSEVRGGPSAVRDLAHTVLDLRNPGGFALPEVPERCVRPLPPRFWRSGIANLVVNRVHVSPGPGWPIGLPFSASPRLRRYHALRRSAPRGPFFGPEMSFSGPKAQELPANGCDSRRENRAHVGVFSLQMSGICSRRQTASHARGRWFEPSRAHSRKPAPAGSGLSLSHGVARSGYRPPGSNLEAFVLVDPSIPRFPWSRPRRRPTRKAQPNSRLSARPATTKERSAVGACLVRHDAEKPRGRVVGGHGGR
jgi:hypothetical protein